jgi:tetratricopeptide (TPR) repeat protein
MFALHCCFDLSWPRAVLSLLTLVALTATASTGFAQADEPSEPAAAPTEASAADAEARRLAGVHFTNGVELFQDGEYDGALIEFRQAYDTSPNPMVLYNIGQTYLAMRRYVDADEAFHLYLERSGDSISEARAADIQQQLASLQRRIGTLRISVNVEGAEVLIDGAHIGVAPLDGPIRVDIGEHRVAARAEAHRPLQVTVMVGGGGQQDVALELVPTSRPEPVVIMAPAAEAESSSNGLRVAAWTMFGGAIALSGVAAWSTANAFQGDDAYRADPTEAGYEDGRRRVNRTYGLAAGAGALSITAVVLGLLARSRHGDDDQGARAVSIDLAPDRLGATYLGSF